MHACLRAMSARSHSDSPHDDLHRTSNNWGEPERAPARDLQRLRCLSHILYISHSTVVYCVYRDGNGWFCIIAIHKEISIFAFNFNSICLLRTSRWRTCEKVTACKGKYHRRCEIQVNTIFTDCLFLLLLLHLFEKANLTNHSTYDSEILQVNRFSSELVHRHIIYSLTLVLLLI